MWCSSGLPWTDISWAARPEECSSVRLFSGLFTLESKVSCCGEELSNLLRGFWRMLIQFTSFSEGEEEVMHMQSCEAVRSDRQRYFGAFIHTCETSLLMRKRKAMCWRMSGKKEPGLSTDLDQPFHGKRIHAVFLFRHAWLYEFIMPLGEHSSKNQHWTPRAHPANPSIGPTFIILTFPLQGSDWHQSGSSARSSVRRWRCHSHSVRGRLQRDSVWVNKIKMRIN